METQSYNKQTLFSDETCLLTVELLNRAAYLHCEVYEWKPSTAKKLYSALKTFLVACEETDIVGVYTITPNPKFAEMYGGRHCGNVGHLGKRYEVYKWDLKF